MDYHSDRHARRFDGLIRWGLGPELGEQTHLNAMFFCPYFMGFCVLIMVLLIQVKAIITKYLSVDGNKLGSAELNTISGPNLCSLDADVLRNISQQSLR